MKVSISNAICNNFDNIRCTSHPVLILEHGTYACLVKPHSSAPPSSLPFAAAAVGAWCKIGRQRQSCPFLPHERRRRGRKPHCARAAAAQTDIYVSDEEEGDSKRRRSVRDLFPQGRRFSRIRERERGEDKIPEWTERAGERANLNMGWKGR